MGTSEPRRRTALRAVANGAAPDLDRPTRSGQQQSSSSSAGSLPRAARNRPRPPPERRGDVVGKRTLDTGPDTYEVLRAQVLDAIAEGGADSLGASAVQALVHERVLAYQQRATSGFGGRPLADPMGMEARLCRSVLHFGALTPFFEGDEVFEEVIIIGSDVSYIDGEGRLAMLGEAITEAELRAIIDRLLASAGAAVDESRPCAQVQVLDGQARLGVVIPPVADRLNVTIRRYVLRQETLAEFIAWDSLDIASASLLAATTRTPTGVVVTGQPGAGKTSMVNAILGAAPATLRCVIAENTPEVNPEHLSPFRWKTRDAGPDGSGEVNLRDLVRLALGMRPDLIVVGEVRGAEAYELTRAGNAGCGMMTTLHANSARQGLQALMSTAIMAGANVPADQVRAVFTQIVDLVVHLGLEPMHGRDGSVGRQRRQVLEISAVPPLQGAEADVAVEPIFVREEFGAPLRWTGAPLPEDLRRRLDGALRAEGLSVQGILEGRDALV